MEVRDDARAPVDAALFDLIHQYADARRSAAADDEPLTNSSSIVQFCLAFFQQLLKHSVGYQLTAIDEKSKAEVARLRLRGRVAPATADLFALYERLCDDWPMLSGVAYDDDPNLKEFHRSYVPRLLRGVIAWAQDEGLTSIEFAARAAADAYHDAEAAHTATLSLEQVDFREAMRLVELDYQRTAGFSDGLVQREAGVRGLAVTIWVATLGFAFGRNSSALAALAAVATVAFMLLDAYYSAVFVQLQSHILRLERLSATYYQWLREPADPDASADFGFVLRDYRFGHRRTLRRVRFANLFSVFDRVVFRFLYPPLVLSAAACSLLIAR